LFTPCANGQTHLSSAEPEHIFTEAPFSGAHASTIVELSDGSLLSAWFAGREEGDPSVEIWTARKSDGSDWSQPRVVTDFPEMPCWNPVLFQDAQKLWLFFKVGPSPREWVGAYRTSTDGGRTWSPVEFLPAGQTGPIRNKPVILSNGDILAGSSVEAGYEGGTPYDAPYRSWASWVERSSDGGKTWHKHGPITVPGENYGVIQPTLWETDNGHVQMLLRSTDRIGKIARAVSTDGGKTWSPARPTELPNPNSGIDAVKLADGRVVLVYNHTEQGRSPIHLAVSTDDGRSWQEPLILEAGDGEFSYPAVIQASDGTIHVTYTWKRQRIRHVAIDPDNLGN
jgi:predicted neuraminidase